MKEIEYGGKKIKVDDEGFLADTEEWDFDTARALARNEGYENLDDEQFEILRFMRGYFHKFHAFPILSYVCKNIHQPRECINEEFVDPMKAWKIAGLPPLEGLQFETVDGEHFVAEGG